MAPTPTTPCVRRNRAISAGVVWPTSISTSDGAARPARSGRARSPTGARPRRKRARPRRSVPRAASGAERSPADGAARPGPGTAPHPSSPIDHPDGGSTRWPPPSGEGVLAPGYRRRPDGAPPLARPAAPPPLRGVLDRRVRVQHRHVDGDGRRRHPRHHVDRTGGLGRHRRRRRLRAQRARSARSAARSPTVSRAGACSSRPPRSRRSSPGSLTRPRRDRRTPHPGAVTLIVLGVGLRARRSASRRTRRSCPTSCRARSSPAAVALGSAQWNLGRVIGPALAGIVITLGGFEWAFAINTVSFLAVIAAIAPLELPPPDRARGRVDPDRDPQRARASRRREPGIRVGDRLPRAELAPRRAVHRARPRGRAEGLRLRGRRAPRRSSPRRASAR